jgi:hypothetical protein
MAGRMKQEFQQTRFLVHDLSRVPTTFGIVTACNPDGVTVSDEQNVAATECLRSALVNAGFYFFAVTGCSPDFRHQEPGFGITTDDRENIVKIGRNWQQEAIFWVEGGIVHLVSCRDPEVVTLGQWSALAQQSD